MRIPLFAFHTQPDFPQQQRDLGYPVFAAVVPTDVGLVVGRGYRIYKVGAGKFQGTWQAVNFVEGAWLEEGDELSLGKAVWNDDRDVWTCEDEPPDVDQHRAAMDASE